ncbi:hypothetical protein VA596_46880 [Amycolatopsis sp., V23-08]|uniref:Uncharacterized protein n=1 Tax=Amycolatopsis heterodermiae TaxID=3110235 RepID=A0ABU5RN60_9PSEU|nr:hypothetical protein [Amycolatopsis sp., V23-08]
MEAHGGGLAVEDGPGGGAGDHRCPRHRDGRVLPAAGGRPVRLSAGFTGAAPASITPYEDGRAVPVRALRRQALLLRHPQGPWVPRRRR